MLTSLQNIPKSAVTYRIQFMKNINLQSRGAMRYIAIPQTVAANKEKVRWKNGYYGTVEM